MISGKLKRNFEANSMDEFDTDMKGSSLLNSTFSSQFISGVSIRDYCRKKLKEYVFVVKSVALFLRFSESLSCILKTIEVFAQTHRNL